MDSSSLDYMFSPLRTSDGGQYTCTATVNITQAGIMDLQNSAVETVVVVGKQPIDSHLHIHVHVKFRVNVYMTRNAYTPGHSSTAGGLVLAEMHPAQWVTGWGLGLGAVHSLGGLWFTDILMYLFVYVCLVAAHPVEEFKVTMSSGTSLIFSWSPPSVAAQFTTGYRLTCTPLLEGISAPNSTVLGPRDTTAAVTGLNPGVTYNCSIVTISREGSSLPQTLTPSTTESGKNSWLYVS